MTFSSRFSGLIFNIYPKVMEHVYVSISENTQSPDISVLYQRNWQRLDLYEPLDECGGECNHQQDEHVLESCFVQTSLFHIEPGGLEASESCFQSPVLVI